MAPRHERIGPLLAGIDRPATAAYPGGAVLRERVLDVSELVWMLRGTATVHGPAGVARGERVEAEETLRPGDVLLLPAGTAHGLTWGTSAPAAGCAHGYVHVELGGVCAPRPVVASSTAEDPLSGLCAYLLWLGLWEPRGWRPRAVQVAGVVSDLVVGGPLPAAYPFGPSRPAVLEALVVELRRRWGAGLPLTQVRVGDLAATLHVSPTHLTRMVRRAWGRPLSVVLQQLRLSRVEMLLAGTSAPLTSVARLCGYADAFHCSRRFTAAHGVTPSRFRLAGARPSSLDDPVIRELADAIWGGGGATR